jgi:RimJ/RimL family protein N-acetyltransferase
MRRRDRLEWNPPRIEGRLVELRHHTPSNLPTVLRWYADPEIARLTRYSTRPMPTDEVERFFQSRLLSTESVAYGVHVRPTGRLVGLTTFSSLDPDNGSVLFHITLGERDAWGHGYGTEAAQLMLWLAFERIGLHRVGLTVFAFNERAIRSYQKVGFRIEGRLREAIVRDDRRWDEIQMGILRDEWLASRALSTGPAAAGRSHTGG